MAHSAVMLGLLLPLALTSCASPATSTAQVRSSTPEASSLTSDQARDVVVRVGRAVVAAIGTPSWVFIDGPMPEECTRADGSSGVLFQWAARGPSASDRTAHAAAARKALQEEGYIVVAQRVGRVIRVVAHSDRLGVVEFDAQPTADGLVVTSSCSTGKAADYADQQPVGLAPSPSTSS